MSGIWDIESTGGVYTIAGNWNANTNVPDLTSVTTPKLAWVVSVAGATSLGGITPWNLGEIAVKTQDGWAKILPSSATWGTIVGTLADQVDLQNVLNLKANDNAVVKLTGNQTVGGIKTFSLSPVVPTPTTDMQASTKKYADDGLALKQDKPNTATENNIATFDANKDTKDSGKNFTEILSTSSPSHNKVPTEKAVEDRVSIIDKLLLNELSNGVKEGMAISINTDTTKINISSGSGIIVDDSTPDTPTYTVINYAGATGVTLTNLNTANATYIAINNTGTIVQQVTEFTPEQRRSLIILGVAIHSNRLIVNVVNNLPDVALNSPAQLNDLMNALQNFNISGNIISANGANLNINKSEGYIFKKGSNFINSNLNPHTLHLVASVAPATLRYRLQDGTEYANTSVIDPSYYDLNSVRTSVPPNKYSIQRLTLFPSNLIRIQYGQAYYGSMAEAIQAISTEFFVEESNIAQNGLLRGLLVVKSGATDLSNNTQAQFFEADRFGSTKFSAGGSATTTLQQAYNNSLQPQIVTSTIGGTVQIKNGTGDANALISEVLDGSNNSVAQSFSNGNNKFGSITAGNYSEFETNGTLKYNGSAIVWDDISLSGLSFAPGGAAAPSLISFVDANTIVYGFSGASTTERLYLSTEMKHDYKEGSDIDFHIHWTPTTNNTGNVKWQVYYTWQTVDGTFSAPTLLTVTTAARGTAWQNTISNFGLISGAGKIINSQLVIQVFRVPTDGADTYPDNAAFIAFGIHYQKDTAGSRQRLTK